MSSLALQPELAPRMGQVDSWLACGRRHNGSRTSTRDQAWSPQTGLDPRMKMFFCPDCGIVYYVAPEIRAGRRR